SLAAQPNRTINEQALFAVTNTASDVDVPIRTVAYGLLTPPAGLSINPTNGVITWTPDETQGPGTNIITTVATDDGDPQLSATNSFTVVVNEVNRPPVLSGQTNVTINELTTLVVTNAATDPDIPANTLTYALLAAPTNAVINTNTGVITWTPNEAQG